LILAAVLRPAFAAETPATPPPAPADAESLRKEVDALKAEVERLKGRPATGGASADDLKDAEERIDALEKKTKELELRQTQTTSANPLTVLNPTLTVVGNFLWRLDDKRVTNENGDRIDDQANLREAELDLRAAIDPYADGVCILSVSSDVPGSYSVDVEEFLINVKSLPVSFWEEPPLGTKIKIGRMRTEFGRNNRLHLHDLPQSDRPLVIDEFLGPDGYAANGISTTSFLPSPGETALELTLQALQGGGDLRRVRGDDDEDLVEAGLQEGPGGSPHERLAVEEGEHLRRAKPPGEAGRQEDSRDPSHAASLSPAGSRLR
jgi:hypothetical protein